MPKAFDILKTRWAEVLLLVGFQTGVLFLMEQIMTLAEQQAEGKPVHLPQRIAFLLGLGTMAFIIIWQMLYLGFLRTAYTDGCQRWEPGQLLRIGRLYFWRMVRFQVLLLVVYSGLAMAGLSVAAALAKAKTPEDLPLWAVTIVLLAVSLALLKPTALSPPIMVARDMMAMRSIRALRQYRLMQEWTIPVIYIGALIFSAAASMADETFVPKGTLHYVVMACHHVIIGIAMLAVHLAALRLVKAGEPPAAAESKGASQDKRA